MKKTIFKETLDTIKENILDVFQIIVWIRDNPLKTTLIVVAMLFAAFLVIYLITKILDKFNL